MSVRSKQVTKDATAKSAQAAPAVINRVRGFSGNHMLMRREGANEGVQRKANETTSLLLRNEEREQFLQCRTLYETAPSARPFGHESNWISFHAKPALAIQPKLTVSRPGDMYEQEADRVAEQVMRTPDSRLVRSSISGFRARQNEQEIPGHLQTKRLRANASGETTVPPIIREAVHSSGQPLTPTTRAFMEERFGRDFNRVRIHSNPRSIAMADALDAEAFTVGHDIYFGPGKLQRRTRESDRLLAHELAHVAQQSRTGPALQRKLKFKARDNAIKANAIPRVIKLLNSGLQNHSVATDESGEVSIKTNVSKQKPNAQQQALATRLTTIINDPKTVTISVSVGSKTLGGNFEHGDIDIADLEVYGVAGLIHEIWEQYQGQVKGLKVGSEKTGAHKEGMDIESEVVGAKRGAQKVISYTPNADKTVDAVLEIPFTYPSGKVKIMVMTVIKSNIVSFKEKP